MIAEGQKYKILRVSGIAGLLDTGDHELEEPEWLDVRSQAFNPAA